MKIEDFIAGAIVGVVFSDKNMQKFLLGSTQRLASFTVDNLNKRGGINAPTTVQTEPIPEPTQPKQQD